jgi:hypothetical protein
MDVLSYNECPRLVKKNQKHAYGEKALSFLVFIKIGLEIQFIFAMVADKQRNL